MHDKRVEADNIEKLFLALFNVEIIQDNSVT